LRWPPIRALAGPYSSRRPQRTLRTARVAAAALASPGIPLDDVRRHFSTVGGINEQYYAAFRDRGGVAALEADAVLERVRATPTESTLDGGAP